MTDESVALALGWEKHHESWELHPWYRQAERRKKAPNYTTSLDAITGEIERRGLGYSLDIGGLSHIRQKPVADVFEKGDTPKCVTTAFADTAPLALCKALISYLEGVK